MTHKLKLLSFAVAAILLSGCQSTPPSEPNDTVALATNAPEDVAQQVIENNTETVEADIFVNQSMADNEYESSELVRAVIDDYKKERMLIQMSCDEKEASIKEKHYVAYGSNGDNGAEFIELRNQAEQVIEELEAKLGDGTDEVMQLTYEVEIARLKLEFEIASLERRITEIETMRAYELDVATKMAATKLECNVKRAEADYDKERMLEVIQHGDKVNKKFTHKLEKLEEQLEISKTELEELNSKAFDGIIF
jgi:hypothetical protein